MQEVDLIIIGAGPGGYHVAAGEAAKGKRVVLIERDAHPGGTCLNRGCIPTKALCACASLIELIKGAGEFGIEVAALEPDFSAAHGRAERVMEELRSGITSMLKSVEVIHGEASLAPGPAVRVNGMEFTADKILIATGSKPAPLRCEGGEYALSSDDVLALDTLPESAVIIGAGVIGLEFACILNAYGVHVTVLEYCKEVLPGQDAEMAKRLRTSLTRKGIKIVTGARVDKIDSDGTVTYEGKKGQEKVKAQTVIAAVGRRPVLPPGIEETGIELTGRGFIAVNDNMETSVPGVYAVGDVNGISMLAHSATAQARRAVGEDVDLSVIPGVVFTSPEFASVGLTEEAAKEQGHEIKVIKKPYGSNGKALADGADQGLVKIITDTAGRILGVHILGAHASDLITEATIAISTGMTLEKLASIIHPHPTLSELLV